MFWFHCFGDPIRFSIILTSMGLFFRPQSNRLIFGTTFAHHIHIVFFNPCAFQSLLQVLKKHTRGALDFGATLTHYFILFCKNLAGYILIKTAG